MEHTNKRKEQIKNAVQIGFVFLIGLFLIIMTVTLVKITENIEVLKKDPITYGIENNDKLAYCYCYDLNGEKYDFPKTEEVNKFGPGNNFTIPR